MDDCVRKDRGSILWLYLRGWSTPTLGPVGSEIKATATPHPPHLDDYIKLIFQW